MIKELLETEARWLLDYDGEPKHNLMYLSKRRKRYMAELRFENPEKFKYFKLMIEYRNAMEKDELREAIRQVHGSVGGTYTLDEIGKVLGVTRERARQIEVQAKKKLKHPHTARQMIELSYGIGDYNEEHQASF